MQRLNTSNRTDRKSQIKCKYAHIHLYLQKVTNMFKE